MDSFRREDWQTGSGNASMQQGVERSPSGSSAQPSFSPGAQSSQQSQPHNAPVLPPPSTFYTPATSGPSNGSFPPLGTMHPSPPDVQRPTQDSAHESRAPSNPPQSHSQNSSISLPGIHQVGQPLSTQTNFDRERERQLREAREREIQELRERDFEARARQEQIDRDRDMRERLERAQYESTEHGPPYGSPRIHQPVAVAPPGATPIHGPNGILAGAAGPQGAPPPQQISGPQLVGTPGPQAPMFGPHFEGTPRLGPQQPPAAPPQMMPFGGTPHMQQTAVPVQGVVAPGGSQPILNDALSYLDQVKVQFSGMPDVYNQFLDIMKDFKSQAIDTPGVIRRVSSLFSGNSQLIQGFNTFLPPGYRIECSADGDPNGIRVSTPQGTIVTPMGETIVQPPQARRGLPMSGGDRVDSGGLLAGDRIDGSAYSPDMRQQEAGFGRGHLSPFEGSLQREHHHQGVNAALLAHQQEQRNVAQLGAAANAAEAAANQIQQSVSPALQAGGTIANGLGLQQGPLDAKRGPVEFNHAISYVNKIKNRYVDQPDIYKDFLEVLQTYQRESRPIQDVYRQVHVLFQDAPDLLRDFKQFLPESAAQAQQQSVRQHAEEMTRMSELRSSETLADRQSRHTPKPEQQRGLPPVGNFHTTPSVGRDFKRKRGEKTAPIAGPDFGAPNQRTGFAANKRVKQSQPQQQQQQQQPLSKPIQAEAAPAVEPTLIPAIPHAMPPATTTPATSEELAFFDRLKKHVGSKQNMNEFLKICNLFTNDLIDKNTLMYRAQVFTRGSPELYKWFSDFVGYDGKEQIIENRARPETGRVSLNNCRGIGPSYRLLPKRERLAVCSGRDELCNSVLNDNWASHPTWASEDSGFISHRKNMHEEGLHRIEEERHDYDHHVAVCDRAIQILEPFAQQIANMAPEQQASFHLPQDFGQQNHFIFKRVLSKIYGREQGQLIITRLNEKPANVVPVILLRIRQKMEEWKLSQREWDKVWREQTQKMFWRSLDHQGIANKHHDKRQFQSKTLQNEIQVKYLEQKTARDKSQGNLPFQMQWSFMDKDVLLDVSVLLLTYTESHYPHSQESTQLMAFLKDFVPVFFDVDVDAFNDRMQKVYEAATPNEEVDDEAPISDESSSQPRTRKANGKKSDLLRDVLERGRKPARTAKEGSVATASRATTPDLQTTVEEDTLEAAEAAEEELKHKTWFTHPTDGNIHKRREIKPNEPFKRNVYNLYANLPIYCFFRVFTIMYERLLALKMTEKEVHDKVRRGKVHKPAIEFGIVDRLPSDYFTNTGPDANFYGQILDMLQDVAKGNMEMSALEEVLRRYYLSCGWAMYPFERMLSSFFRFASAVHNVDPKDRSHDIMALFYKDRRKEMTTHQDEVTLRKQVEKYVKDSDIYRIAYNADTSHATVRVLKRTENTFDVVSASSDTPATHAYGVITAEDRWRLYITLYQSLDATEDIDYKSVKRVAGQRGLRATVGKAERDAEREWLIAQQQAKEIEGAGGDGEAAVQGEIPKKTAWEARVQSLVSNEGLQMRISPSNYLMVWTEDTVDWWQRVGGTKEKTMADARGKEKEVVGDDRHENDKEAMFLEKSVMNNAWMAGLSRDAVDEVNKEYREWKGVDGEEARAGNNNEEVALMADAGEEKADVAMEE